MILIVCIDDDGGMLFNRRRQSKDSVLRLRMLGIAAESRLWMNDYSASQFEEEPRDMIQIAEDPLGSAEEGDYCFVENLDPSGSLEKIEKVILYKWNRKYPSDLKFTIDLSQFELAETTDFEGSSHDKITEEIYIRSAV